jgi:hypothetical protein
MPHARAPGSTLDCEPTRGVRPVSGRRGGRRTRPTRTLTGSGPIVALAISPDSRKIAAASQDGGAAGDGGLTGEGQSGVG